MAIVFYYSGPRAHLVCHGYVYTLRYANRKQGITIATTDDNVTGDMEKLVMDDRYVIFPVFVQKIMEPITGPEELKLFEKHSGGLKAERWYQLARGHVSYPARMALYKVIEIHKWARGVAQRENAIYASFKRLHNADVIAVH